MLKNKFLSALAAHLAAAVDLDCSIAVVATVVATTVDAVMAVITAVAAETVVACKFAHESEVCYLAFAAC